jgi:hypothetical protein
MTNLYDNWLVLGPKRSGTWAVARALLSYKPYKLFSRIEPSATPTTVFSGSLVHSHNIGWLDFVNDNTGIAICVRNPIGSAFSNCILPKFGNKNNQPIWHFEQGDEKIIDQLGKNIEPFYLNPELFALEMSGADAFYKQIMNWPHWKRCSIIEYESWESDPTLILSQLGMEYYTPKWPLKNPGTPQQWIKNFDEIMDCSKSISLDNYNQICQRK